MIIPYIFLFVNTNFRKSWACKKVAQKSDKKFEHIYVVFVLDKAHNILYYIRALKKWEVGI